MDTRYCYTMNTMTNGTQYRTTPVGMIAVRGQRELHLLGTSAAQAAESRRLLADESFDQLYKRGRKPRGMRNVAFLRVGA